MRHISLTVSEHSGTPRSSTRHFDARLLPEGDVHITGIDDDSWYTFAPDSTAAVLLAAILSPSVSVIDRARLTHQYWSPVPDGPDPLAHLIEDADRDPSSDTDAT